MSVQLCFEGKIVEEITYEETMDLSQKLDIFFNQFVSERSNILLFMDHNIYIPAIILSLKKAAHCFTFISERASDNEIQDLLEAAKIQFILMLSTSPCLYENFKEVGSFCLKKKELLLWKHINLNNEIFGDLLCIISSSGTTGKKKLIKIEKNCIQQNVICLNKIFNLNSNDVIFFGTPLTFDPSLVELFLAFKSQAKLLIVSDKTKMNFQSLFKTLFPLTSEYPSLTFLQMVPSLFRRWSLEQVKYILNRSDLKVLALGGEPFPHEILEFKRTIKVYNLYGITEISCWATVHEIGESNKVFLGKPLDETFVKVCNNEKTVEEGIGELFIGSETRHCYINDEREKLIWRSTGDLVNKTIEGIEYIGRTNNCIKRLGYKILLDEIENKVNKITKLPSRCIWIESSSKLLLFILIPSIFDQDKMRILDKLRVRLLHSLSKEEFPDFLDIIPAFPVTENGKLDRITLLKVYKESQAAKMNEKSCDIFLILLGKYLGQSVLNFSRIKELTFYELGGNSILYTLFINNFKDILNCDLPYDFLSLILNENIEKCFNYLNSIQLIQSKRQDEPYVQESANQIKKKKHSVKADIIWKYNLQGCIDATPLVFETNGNVFVAAGSFANFFMILDAFTGELKFKEQFSNAIGCKAAFSPHLNFLYIGCFDGNLYCINIEDDKVQWIYQTGDSIKSNPTFCQNNQAVVFGSYDKCLHCICAKAGTIMWKTDIQESVITPLVLLKISNELFVTTLIGSCISVCEDTGNVNWRINLGNPIFSPVYLVNEESLICSDVQGYIYLINKKSTEKCVLAKIEGEIFSSLVILGEYLVVCSHNGFVYKCEMRKNYSACDNMNKLNLNDAISSSPCVFQYFSMTIIAIFTVKGNLFLVNFNNMEVISQWKCPGDVFSSLVYHNQKLFVGCRDDNLYCININSLIDLKDVEY